MVGNSVVVEVVGFGVKKRMCGFGVDGIVERNVVFIEGSSGQVFVGVENCVSG